MEVLAGSTDVTTYFKLRLAADGTEATGLTITNFDLQYVRSGATPAAKVDATALAATNSAHGDNQAIEVDATDQPGLYRVDWPDAAFAAGAREVILTVKCATAFTEDLRVNLTPVPVNVTQFGSTAGTFSSGRPEVNTSHLAGSATPVTNMNTVFNTDFANNYNATDDRWKVDVTHWLDDAVLVPYQIGVPMVDIQNVGGITTQNRGWDAVRTGSIQASSSSSITLDASASATNDFYKGNHVCISDSADEPVNQQVRLITAYNGTTKVATIAPNWRNTPGAGTTTFTILHAVGAALGDTHLWRGTVLPAPTVAGVPAVETIDISAAGQTDIRAAVGLSTANLDTQLSTIDDLIDTEIGTIITRIGVPASSLAADIAALNDLSAAQVNAEVVDALATDTYAEPGQGAPGATLSLAAKINWLYTSWRNKKNNEGTTTNLYADNGSTIIAKQLTGSSGGTVEKAEWITGA